MVAGKSHPKCFSVAGKVNSQGQVVGVTGGAHHHVGVAAVSVWPPARAAQPAATDRTGCRATHDGCRMNSTGCQERIPVSPSV